MILYSTGYIKKLIRVSNVGADKVVAGINFEAIRICQRVTEKGAIIVNYSRQFKQIKNPHRKRKQYEMSCKSLCFLFLITHHIL